MPDNPYLQWPVFRRSVVAAFGRSLTGPDFALRTLLKRRIQVGSVELQSACSAVSPFYPKYRALAAGEHERDRKKLPGKYGLHLSFRQRGIELSHSSRGKSISNRDSWP